MVKITYATSPNSQSRGPGSMKFNGEGRGRKKDNLHYINRNLNSVVRTTAVQLILQNLTGKVRGDSKSSKA